jgi:hypothetical protein
MGTPPHLSNDQRRAALMKAASSRKIRAEFKTKVKNREVNWTEAFHNSDEAIRKMRVKELLLSLPGYGEVRALNVMEQAGISNSRRVQGVGKTQYQSLLRILKEGT